MKEESWNKLLVESQWVDKTLLEFYLKQVFDVSVLDFHKDHSWVRFLSKRPNSTIKVVQYLPLQYRHILKVVPMPALMYPLTGYGLLLGFGFRSLKEKAFYIETKSPLYFYTSVCSWSSNVVMTPPLFVEGVLDCESMSQFHLNTVAFLGSHIAKKNLSFFSNVIKVWLTMFDNDPAGDRARERVVWLAPRYKVKVISIQYPKKYKDPADFVERASSAELGVVKGMIKAVAKC